VTVTLDIDTELLAALRTMARKAGLEPDRYMARALQEHVERHQNAPPNLPQEETRILQQINQGLPAVTWQRYHELVARRRSETLTPEEHQELIALTNEVELWHARRIELVAELAGQRGVSFDALMDELGLKQPANA
jgi:hypothetical protein